MAVATLACLTGPASAQTILATSHFYKVVSEGQTVQVAHFESLDPDCRSRGTTQVNLLSEPQGGHILTRLGRAFPNYPSNNPRAVCMRHRTPATLVMYRADKHFVGNDVFDVEAVYPDGLARKFRYAVVVR